MGSMSSPNIHLSVLIQYKHPKAKDKLFLYLTFLIEMNYGITDKNSLIIYTYVLIIAGNQPTYLPLSFLSFHFW